MEQKVGQDFVLELNERTLPVIEQVADKMPGGFFIYEAFGEERILCVNRVVLRIFGCDTLEEFRELTGYTFRGFVHPDDLEGAERSISRQIDESDEDLDYVEYRIIRKDGGIRWIRDYGHFVHTEGYGDVFYVFIDDATDIYVEMQEEKRKAEVIEGLSAGYDSFYLLDFERDEIIPYRLQEAVLHSLDCVFSREQPLWEEEFGSGRAGRMVGSYRRFVQEYASHFVVPEDRQRYIQESAASVIQERLKKVGSYLIDFQRYNAEGGREWEQLFFASIEDENKNTRAVAGYRTVTEQVEKVRAEAVEKTRMEYELDEAKHANQAKSAFLFNISHDIRTPMNAIMGFTALAKKYIDQPERLADYLNKVEMSNDHLQALINDVLDMSQIESGVIQIRMEVCNLKEQLSIVLEMLTAQALEKDLEFTAQIDITDEDVYADPLNLRRIFVNVIGNAVKFTPRNGKVDVKVDQVAQVQAGYASYRFVISDTGVGMSKDFMRHMFEAFERENTSTITGYQGSGLGLTIAKNLVDLMGGSITAESEKGRGSVFTVMLAFKIADGPGPRQAERLGEILNKWSEDRLRGRRILLVEDNELNREIATEILIDAGFKVEAVPDGCDAVEAVRRHTAGYYDFVLMDIQMPIMNGYEAAAAIRSLDREDVRDLPIIALSANAMYEDQRRSLESGMNAHISKPIDIMNLIGTLRNYIP